jgi:hypothetical protein
LSLSREGGAPGSLSGVTKTSVFGNQDSVVVAADNWVVFVVMKDSRLQLVHARVEERTPKDRSKARP